MPPVPPPDPAPGPGGAQPPRPGGGAPAGLRADAMRPADPAGADPAPWIAAAAGDHDDDDGDWDGDAYLAWFLASLINPAGPDAAGEPAGPGGAGFGRDEIAAVLRPGPQLWALAEQAAAGPAALTGHELLAMVSAARRLAARAEYLELAAVAEFTRRARAACDASAAAGDAPGRRRAEFAVTELAFELGASDHAAATGWTWPPTWPPGCRTRSPDSAKG